MLILVVTGMPGAGKEEFLSVASSLGISFVRMGDVVREAYRSSEANSNMSVGEFAGSERDKYGTNIWAERTIEKMHGKIFLVDGCRSMVEIRSFRELSDNVKIIGIHSAPDVRYKRLVKRGRDDAPKNIDEFNERDSREISWGISEVLALSDIMIVNSTTLDDFHSASGKILKEIR